ncbi:unnamed protein product [Durusdinium trenchii]
MALRVRALSRGLAKWRGYASRSHLVRRSVASFHRRRARAISRALNCWWLFCEARRQKEWLRIAKCKLAQKVRCFKRWHRYVASTRWRRPERRAEDVRCWHLSGAQQVLQAWRSYAQRSARDRHALRRSLEAQVAEASACLQGWHEVALGERDLRRQKEVAACPRLRQLRRRQAVHWLCARQDLGRRLGSHERKSQVRVFQIWRAQTRRARPFRRRLAWLVEVRRQMLRAWCHVAGLAFSRRPPELGVHPLKSGLGRRRRLVRCFCGDRLAERALRRAFEGWRRTRDFWLGCYASISYEEELSSAQLVARVLRAWWHAAVGRPAACAEAARGVVLEAQRHWIRRWHHCVVQRDQLAEILCKHMTRCAALALLGWSLYAADQTFYRQHLLAAMLSCWQQDAVRGSEKKRHAGPQMATWKRAVAEFAVFGRRRRFFQLWREARRPLPPRRAVAPLDGLALLCARPAAHGRAGKDRSIPSPSDVVVVGMVGVFIQEETMDAAPAARVAPLGDLREAAGGDAFAPRGAARGKWPRSNGIGVHRVDSGWTPGSHLMASARLLQRTLQRWQWEVRSRVVARGIQAKRRHLWKISLLSAWREECQRLQLLRVVWTCWLRHRQQERHGRALRVLGPFMAAWRGHGHAREGLRRRAAEHLLQALAKTREQLRDLAFVLWAQRTARAAEQRGQLWHLEAQRSAGVLKHCLRCWLHVLRAHQGERRRAKDALLACARGWRTLTEHGLHSRRSERAVVAWRFLLLDLLEYARPARA